MELDVADILSNIEHSMKDAGHFGAFTVTRVPDDGGGSDIPDTIKTTRAVPLRGIEDFFVQVFEHESSDLPDLPFSDAMIERFEVARGHPDLDIPVRADITVSFANTLWSPATGMDLQLKAISLGYWGGKWSGTLVAAMHFQGLDFEIEFEWPSMTLRGWIAPEISTSKLLSDHGLTPSDGRQPTVQSIEVMASARIQAIQVEVVAKDLLTLGPLHLANVDITLGYHGGPHADFTGSVIADATIQDWGIYLQADRTPHGWLATGGVRFDGKPLREVIHDVSMTLFSQQHELSDYGVPESLASSKISGDVTLEVNSGDQHVTLRASIKVSSGQGMATFEVTVAKEGLTVRADLLLGDLRFDADFRTGQSTTMLAAQFASEHGVRISLKKLTQLMTLGDADSSAIAIGEEMSITIRDVLIAMVESSKPRKTQYLLAADIDGGIDLSGLGDLPLIGTMLPRELTLRLSLAPVLLTSSWTEYLAELNALRGDSGPHLPDDLTASTLGASIVLPGDRAPLDLGLHLGDTSGGGSSVPVTASPAAAAGSTVPADPVTWKIINKSLGPVHLGRVGLALDRSNKQDPAIRILLDASLGLAGLELSLVGLEAHYALTSGSLGVSLQGIGLDIDRDPVVVKGAFARIGNDYVGLAQMRLGKATIRASGGFAVVDGAPAMFIYGTLAAPIGGPPFFSVEALAAGFGVNRHLSLPALHSVHDFPFVADALSMSTRDQPPDLDMADGLTRLADSVRPSLGENFFAVGVKFSSFKVLDSFLLAIVSTGSEIKIDLLGVSVLQNPPVVPAGTPPMVRIELDLIAAIRPSEGSVIVQAALSPDSYVYSPDVKLSGGFAFASWFAGPHAGDFVVSVGGYHPSFRRPDHYPAVQRVGLALHVPGYDVAIKGQVYFALTPLMMMAGGSLEAHARFGKVAASFEMAVDFIIQWQPYHYEITARVSIAAQWWVFSAHCAADLQISGPEFGGSAHVQWTVISFDVAFGRAIGGGPTIPWADFATNFLPKDPQGTVAVAPTLTVSGGLVSTIDVSASSASPAATPAAVDTVIHVVNARDLEVHIQSVLPFSSVTGDLALPSPQGAIGCRPVGVTSVKAQLHVACLNGEAFSATAHGTEFPAALWGPPGKPSLGDKATVTAWGAVTIRLLSPVQPGGEVSKPMSELWEFHSTGQMIPAPATDLITTRDADASAVDGIVGSAVSVEAAARRSEMLTGLGLPPRRAQIPEATRFTSRSGPIILEAAIS